MGEHTIMQIDILFQEVVRQGTYLRSWSPRTSAIYRVAYNRLRACLEARKQGSLELRDLTRANLDTWVCEMRNDGLTPGGSNVNIRSINSFLSWLSTEGHLSSPIKMRTLPRRSEVLPTFSDAEIRALLSHRPRGIYETRAWVLVLTLLDTGIRIDEALGLEQARVDFDSLQMRVLGKGNRERVVPFSLALRRQLFRLAKKSPGRLMFQTFRGDRMRYRERPT